MLLGFYNVWEQVVNVIDIRENEGFLRVESKGNNIFDVVDAHLNCTIRAFKFTISSKDILFVISNLDNKGDIECILQVFGENHRHTVTHMK